MLIQSLSFAPAAATPPTHAPGVVLAAPQPPVLTEETSTLTVYGACRAADEDVEVHRTEVLSGIFITAVNAATQAPYTVTLTGPRVLFDEDVMDIGDERVASFRFELVIPRWAGAHYLHACFRRHVSNVILVAGYR